MPSALDGRSEEHEYQLPLVDDEQVEADILARGIPIGLMHSMGAFDEQLLRADASLVTRITHGSPLALTLVEGAARAVALAARGSLSLDRLRGLVAEGLPDGEVKSALLRTDETESAEPTRVLTSALDIVSAASSFQDALELSVALGGPTDARTRWSGLCLAEIMGARRSRSISLTDLRRGSMSRWRCHGSIAPSPDCAAAQLTSRRLWSALIDGVVALTILLEERALLPGRVS